MTEDADAAVGILFSSSSTGNLGILIPIRHVLKKLDVELVSDHGV